MAHMSTLQAQSAWAFPLIPTVSVLQIRGSHAVFVKTVEDTNQNSFGYQNGDAASKPTKPICACASHWPACALSG